MLTYVSSVYTVDVVLFCALTELQLQLYRALLRSRAVTSCFRSFDSAQHLRCISALKKLCNHAQLLHAASVETSAVCADPEVSSVICCFVGILNSRNSGHLELGLTLLISQHTSQ